MARSWSRRARRDFDERRDYRKERGEEDRYKKRDDDRSRETREEDEPRRGREEGSDESRRRETEKTRDDRRDERGYEYTRLGRDDREALLMQIRNAGPDEDVDRELDRLREEYDYYEMELDDYDEDYDRVMREMEDLRRDNRRYMLREGAEVDRRQERDIVQDNDAEKTFDNLWDEREG